MKYDVFISYSSKDQKIIEALCHYLEDHNLRCFVAYRDIPKGEDWGTHIPPAIKESKIFIYVHTKNSNKSIETTREIQYALDYRTILIPFRLEDIPLITEKEYRLKCSNWMDAFPKKPEEYFLDLYNTIIVNFSEKKLTFIQKPKHIIPKKTKIKWIYIIFVIIILAILIISNNIIKDNKFKTEYSKYSSLVKEGDSLYNIMKYDEAIYTYSQASEYEDKYISSKYHNHFTHNVRLSIKNINDRFGYINGFCYADLGLPSGLKWATCNIGANSAEEGGYYFAWGEVNTKEQYNENSYAFCHEKYEVQYGNLMSMYYKIYDNEYDNLGNISNTTYDVAKTNWGSGWRMPTKDDFEELENCCIWEWTTFNEKTGYRITGSNGNSIFLPTTGFLENDTMYFSTTHGYYWSSTPSDDVSSQSGAYSLYFYREGHKISNYYRYIGRCVRPVTK